MNNEFNFETNPYGGFAPQPKKKNGFSIASLVLGIVSLVGCCCCCGEILGTIVMGVAAVLALVFAFLSKKENGGKMDGKAIAGLVLGIVALVFLVLFLIFAAGASAMFGSMTEEEFIAFFDQNLKPYVDEATYEEFINGFKEGFAQSSGQ